MYVLYVVYVPSCCMTRWLQRWPANVLAAVHRFCFDGQSSNTSVSTTI